MNVTGRTPSARSVFVDAPSGVTCPAMMISSRLFFLVVSFRRTYSVLGSTVDEARGERTIKSSVWLERNLTGDFAPGNSDAAFVLMTIKPLAFPWMEAVWRSSGISLPASSPTNTSANSGSDSVYWATLAMQQTVRTTSGVRSFIWTSLCLHQAYTNVSLVCVPPVLPVFSFTGSGGQAH